jgi:N-acetyl-alpha-D-muramate 1-phosphate uridylyltransferase
VSLPVAILAGGLATRLLPVTERIPKALVEAAGRPFAAWQIELLRAHGLTDLVFLVGHLGEMVRDALGDGSRWGVRLRFAFDGPRPLGTGGAIRQALPLLGDRFFVLYGDSYLECDYEAVERAFLAGRVPGLMTVCRNDDRWDRSNIEFAGGRIVRYDKQRRTAAMRHIDYGLGAFERAAFERWPEGARVDLADVYARLLADGELAGYEVAGRFYEIGSPEGLAETQCYLAGKGRHEA